MTLQVLVERTCHSCGRPLYRISGELTHDSGIDRILRDALTSQKRRNSHE